MNSLDFTPSAAVALKPVETWRQLPGDPDLWHHHNGVIVNSAALAEREYFYTVIRIGLTESMVGREQHILNFKA